jgi:hypothetical protein
MKHQRILNKTLLRARIKEVGLEMTAVRAECSASLLQKLVSESYEAYPSLRTVDGLCRALGLEMNDLFPVCEVKKEAG